MAKHLHILDLKSITNLHDGTFQLQFPSQELILESKVVQGIALWMRANRMNGGFYSLELGSHIFNSDRPRGNHHEKHKERLLCALQKFGPWVDINARTDTEDTEHHENGIIWFNKYPALRVFREKSGDYILQYSEFVNYALGKLN